MKSARGGAEPFLPTGAKLAGALELLAGDHEGRTVLVIICDSGLKYLSADLSE